MKAVLLSDARTLIDRGCGALLYTTMHDLWSYVQLNIRSRVTETDRENIETNNSNLCSINRTVPVSSFVDEQIKQRVTAIIVHHITPCVAGRTDEQHRSHSVPVALRLAQND